MDVYRRTVRRGVNLNGLGAANWDYPSISVDGAGRVIIGSVYFIGNTQQNGYWTAVAADGANFTTPSRVGNDPGRQSRVVATSSLFEAFVPIQNMQGLPTLINRWESSDGQHWSGPLSIGMGSFGAPWNNTPVGTSSTILFYAPLLAATGYTNGQWAVSFQANNNGYNNVTLCTSDRGCGWVNAANVDEFLSGVSVSGDQAYWVHYLTYSTIGSRNPPLITQALYFPSGGAGIGATINTGIDPTSWLFTNNRCIDNNQNPISCYAAGDFNTIASNPFAAVTTPFIQRSAHIDDLFQSFVEDPQATANVPNFKPNYVPVPYGADVSALAVYPAGLRAYAPPPGVMIGVPSPAARPAQ